MGITSDARQTEPNSIAPAGSNDMKCCAVHFLADEHVIEFLKNKIKGYHFTLLLAE